MADINGTSGNDILTGTAGNDTLHGLGGNDSLDGGAGNDSLVGGAGDDTLRGGAGADTMEGGTGDDRYLVESAGDVVTELASEGTDTVLANLSYTLGANVENLTLTGSLNLTGTGNDLNNVLTGNTGNDSLVGLAGNDTLISGTGTDTLVGGTGDDAYTVNSSADVVVEDASAGTDTVTTSVSYTLSNNVENLVGSAGGLSLVGNALANTITGSTGNNTISGLAGNDVLNASAGNDSVLGGDGADTLNGGTGADTLDGGTGNDSIVGGGGNDSIVGGDGNDTLDGSTGNDTHAGGAGNDTYYVDSATDVITEALNAGTDSVISTATTYTLADNVEKITLSGTSNLSATGNALDNTFFGNTGDNTLVGGAGNDTFYAGAGADSMQGGAGNDSYVVDQLGDTVIEGASAGTDTVRATISYTLGSNFENLELGAGTDLSAVGNTLANTITGNATNNFIDGKSGNDTLSGGAGDDTYVVDASGDVVTENADSGTDQVNSGVSYTLGANIENVTLTGTGNLNATGNSGDNVITGNSGANLLSGGTGADNGTDSFVGGAGHDTYVVDSANDVVTEALNAGTDQINTSVNYTLSANVENLLVTGTVGLLGTGNALDNYLTGASGNDTLVGDAGADTLRGMAGNDVLQGGAGNDLYLVDAAGDSVVEAAGAAEGDDTIQANVTYTLGDNVENLTLTGTGNFNATGNSLDNILKGNLGNNLLDGDAGSDAMAGGDGNDTYVVDDAGDTTSELAGGGTDEVQASVDWTLASQVENLVLSGTDLAGTGNELNNTITGDIGNDTLDGGTGADTLVGGDGDDSYVVNSSTDVVTEAVDGGDDTVSSSVNYTLGDNIENLLLTGSSDLNGTGNADDNLIVGTDSTNLLDGAAGADTLEGGDGDDTYVVDDAGDTVTEAAGEGTDEVQASLDWTLSANVDNLVLTGSDSIDGTGNALDNLITGNTGNNSLDGGSAGNDTLVGGAGNDTYVAGSGNVTIIEWANEGTDWVQSAASYTLASTLENLTLTGTSAIDGTGNNANNVIEGNDQANDLDGLKGNDTLTGQGGDDTYHVDSSADVITEDASEGTDWVEAEFDYTLSDNLENLTLVDNGYNLSGTGNDLNNSITGNAADNLLDGGVGEDSLIGGDGNDTYVIDDIDDVVTENASEGTDEVQSAIDYTLGAELENLTLTGTDTLTGTGNSLDNVITGNEGDNTLDGDAGDDTLAGGAGDDLYIADSSADVVTELGGEGSDTVEASVSYTLAAQVEDLVLVAGAGNINGTGNTQANSITGNEGDNSLNGVSGADSLIGGNGDDTYVVNSADDEITEVLNEGVDLVESSVDWTLGANVDNLVLTGTGDIDGTGNALDNEIDGNDGDNSLDGAAGQDSLTGGDGDDTYVVDDAGDEVSENAGEGVDLVEAGISYTLGADVDNLTLTGSADIDGTGNSLDNVITGNTGDNALDGDTGADSQAGGDGNDTYTVNSADDVVTEAADEGHDLVNSSVSWTLSDNVEDLTLTGSDNIDGTGNALDNVITGNTGNNSLDGAAGEDSLTGGAGDDTYVVDDANDVLTDTAGADLVESSVSWTLGADFENLVLTGTDDIDGTGNTGNNEIDGNDGDNSLDGAAGEDSLTGGAGDDTYVVDDAGDVVTEDADEGTDLVESSIDYTLGANLENLTLTGSDSLAGTGNTLNNVITGNTGDNALDGDTGADSLAGGAGDDTYTVNSADDEVTEAASAGQDLVNSSVSWTLSDNVEDLTLTGSDNIDGTGNALDNVITGNTGNNSLDGAAGEDSLTGGAGDDTYVVDDANDVLTDTAGADLVESSVSWTLGADFENLVLTGTDDIDGTGNTGNNEIDGNDGDNSLDGAAGEDSLTGGAGDDTYVVDDAGDVVTEDADEGTDLVESSIDYTLGANLENLTLTGSDSLAGTGNTLNNVITGNTGDNALDGDTGADSLTGGDGNDTYTVNSADDVVTEAADEGQDLVNASVSWTLSDNVEDLTLTGTANINGTGNALNNVIVGNSGNNTLTGGAGTDTLEGGTGNDTYDVDGGETITENSASGTDRVRSTVSWTLEANVEDLVLRGSTAINGTGNTLNNTIIGNDAVNLLDGGTGNDTLSGRGGNDTYVVDSTGDSLIENNNAGTDLVTSSVTWALGTYFENLTLTGTDDINGAGNSVANVLTGNTGDNKLSGAADSDTLQGGDGDDTLQGGTGNDALDGGAGNDVIYTGTAGGDNAADALAFGEGDGNDTVYAYANAEGAADTLVFDSTVTASELVVSRDGDDLVLGLTSTSDTLNVKNFFSYSESGEFTVGTIAFSTDPTATLTYEDILAQTLIGTGGDDVLTGYATDDEIVGNAGNDTLHGNAGSDTLTGGEDDDAIYSGTVSEVDNESDTIVYELGDGDDVIYTYASTLATSDVIQLGAGIAEENLSASQDGLDLVLDIGGTGTLTIDGFFEQNQAGAYTVGSIELDDGTILAVADILALIGVTADPIV